MTPQTNLQIKPWPEKLSFIVSDRKNVQTSWRGFEAGSSWSCLWSWIAYSFWASMVHQVQPEQTTITKLKDELADQIFQPEQRLRGKPSGHSGLSFETVVAFYWIWWQRADGKGPQVWIQPGQLHSPSVVNGDLLTPWANLALSRDMVNLALKLVWVEKVLNKTFYNVIA